MLKAFKQGGIVLLAICLFQYSMQAQNTESAPAQIRVHLGRVIGDMNPIWAWFGYDEPNYTYMKNGKLLLSEMMFFSPVPVHIRTHNLLTSGDGKPALKWGSTNIYTEDANGNPVYNYRIVDSIFDVYVKRGIKPLAQIGFMPEALSVHPEPYQHHWKPGVSYENIETGWAYPPRDYKKWGELVYQWVRHCVERYGQKEVESWYWEVWNEPNIGYWKGTMPEFFKLYDFAADGVKRALPTARVGGPDVTGGATKWLSAFLKHCLADTNYATGKIGSPLDVILFHAKGAPRLDKDTVVMGIQNQLNAIADHFKTINSYPQLKNIPIIIGESDPEGCAACSVATNPENAYRNGTMYSSYTAAAFARTYALADEYHENLIGAVSWSFEFEDQPWFAGFRDLATNGVDKPVLNVFRMFGKMTGRRVEVEGNRMYPLTAVLDSGIRGKSTDIGALASRTYRSASIMVWNYHDKDKQDKQEPITVTLDGLTVQSVRVTEYRIDNEHSNAYEAWKKMGSPQNPTVGQTFNMQLASSLHTIGNPSIVNVSNASTKILVNLPRQGVSLLKIDW